MITIGKKRKGARRNPNRKRPVRRIDFMMLWLRRFGMILAGVVFTVWLGAWFWLSGAVQSAADWSYHSAIQKSAEAGFSVENILVEGRVNTDPDVLLGLVNIRKGDPIFSFEPDVARDLIERISWVKSVHVERRLPDTIFIELTERRPLALFKRDNKLVLIDEEGKALTDYNLRRFSDLIMVDGENAPLHTATLVANLMAEPALAEKMEMASWVGDRRWNLRTENGIEIKLPSDDIGLALRRLAVAEEENKLLSKSLEHIDLRKPDRIIVQSAPGKVEELQIDQFLKAGYSSGDDI